MHTCKGDVLFSRVKTLPIRDAWAKPKLSFGVLTNITELVKTPERDAMISLFFRDKKCEISARSDFEYFQALLSLLPNLIGTREGEILEEEMFILLGNSIQSKDLTDEWLVKNLWQTANEELMSCNGKYESFLIHIGVEKLYHREEPFAGLCRVEKCNKGDDDFFWTCDFRGLDFVRPDAYHARLAEEKSRQGAPLSVAEESLLAAQAVYCLCSDERNGNVEIHLQADGDGKTASELISYLKRLHIRGEVWIAADGRMTPDTLLALCGQSDADLFVRPEIVMGDFDSRRNARERLAALSAVYPMTLWRFGGVPTHAPMFVAAHMHMRRILCDLIAEVATSNAEAERLATQMLLWN